MADSKLHVENLTISFHTTDGKLQAVRGINFDLQKGETLAIVGESGSGKSVTSKAILGILANNAIVEDGEIYYDGKDLLKISEEDFHRIRGDKIAMIFQDPMSSLNPIVKIGRQLTEAMILKGKARQTESRKNFNTYLKKLKKMMITAAAAEGNETAASDISEKCRAFNKFEYTHLDLEGKYNAAHEAAVEAVADIDNILFEIEKNGAKDVVYRLKRIADLSVKSVETYVVNARADELKSSAYAVKSGASAAKKTGDYSTVVANLNTIRGILAEAIDFEMPNFFALGYYLTFSGQDTPDMPVCELNKFTRKYLDDSYMLSFIESAKKALIFSADLSYHEKEVAIAVLKQYRPVFEKEKLDRKECENALRVLEKEVNDTIDKLDITKDSTIYTFGSSMHNALDKYFDGIVKNKKETARFEKETAKFDKLVAKGKEPDWKVVAASITDLDAVRKNMLRQIDRLIAHYEALFAERGERDYEAETVAAVDYLKLCASGVVNRVTPSMAKNKAIKLMEEVGIAEPRKRYNQYPFEFSGGMRQRIVIAIALAADPDILICDEPTTALDVTIQAQILELINKIKAQRNLSIIFITHDLGVVANMADKIAVMYAGKIVEYGTADDIFYRPAHPYTWALLSSMPDLDTNEKLEAIPGTPPNMIYPPVGDAFADRNKYAMQIDFEAQPPMFRITDTHSAATWLLHPNAPKVEMPKIVSERIKKMEKVGGACNE